MTDPNFEETLEEEFHVSAYIIIYKFTLGLIEVLAALAIIFLRVKGMAAYNQFVARELLEDPHDMLVSLTQTVIPYIANHNTTLVIYLLSLGLAKIAGSIGLIYRRNWGVDLLIGLTVLLLPFQFYNFLIKHSWADLAYMIIGVLIALFLVNFNPRQYTHHLKNRFKKTTAKSR